MSFSGKVAIVAGAGAKVAPSDLKERPGDIASGLGAGARLFPLSDKAGSITGAEPRVDGGRAAKPRGPRPCEHGARQVRGSIEMP